jgi:hypothetical protein
MPKKFDIATRMQTYFLLFLGQQESEMPHYSL